MHTRFHALLCLAAWIVLILPGCTFPETGSTLREENGVSWQPDRFRQHLLFFNDATTEGRSTASRGYARAAQYVAERFADARLQPILAGEYRIQLAGEVTVINRAILSLISPLDTLNLIWGRDFVVDARSGAGTRDAPLRSDRLHLIPGPIIPFGAVDGLFLETDHSVPGMAAGNVEAPIVLRLLPASLDAFFRHVGDRTAAGESSLVRAVVGKESAISTGMMDVGAIIPGADPRARDSLILVMAPLDGFGAQGGRQWTDGSDMAVSAAAVLEVATRTAEIQRQWSLMRMSVMFVLVSGTRSGCEGARAFMRRLPWSSDRVAHVMLLPDTPTPETGCDWNTLEADATSMFTSASVALLASSSVTEQEDPDLVERGELMTPIRLNEVLTRSRKLARDLSDAIMHIDHP